jgi:LmbE family N-acetylglucosaminyl deacetylase
MTNITANTNDHRSPVLTAPDGSTTFRASSIPTARQIADWCHPRGNPESRIRDSGSDPVTSGTVEMPSRLLGVWAHPDDEAYLSAGLMARTVAAGGRVTVVAITDGEAGFPADDPRPPEQRAELRRRELRAAMALIGVHDVRFLGIADGGVATAPADRLVAQIDDIIREVYPDAIVTFGPDGITGHTDHVTNSALVTRAWMNSRIGELWYAAKTNEWLTEWRELNDDLGVWMTGEPTGVRVKDVDAMFDLDGAALATKRAVLAEHRSQTTGLAAAFGERQYRRWISQEAFRRPSARELIAPPVLVGSVAS